MQNDLRLTGEITINFDTYGSKEELMTLIDDFNEYVLKMNDFNLDNGKTIRKTRVNDFDLTYRTLEDGCGEIVDLQEVYIK